MSDGMGFGTGNPVASVTLEIQKEIELTLQEFGEELARLGEQCVNEARETGSYTDRTGNLRSSVSYVVARDGQVLSSGQFAKVLGKDNPKNKPVNGDEVGKTAATQSATELSKDGFALVIIAGMEYASYVSDKGYNVLDSAELLAEERIRTRFAKLGFGSKETTWGAFTEIE